MLKPYQIAFNTLNRPNQHLQVAAAPGKSSFASVLSNPSSLTSSLALPNPSKGPQYFELFKKQMIKKNTYPSGESDPTHEAAQRMDHGTEYFKTNIDQTDGGHTALTQDILGNMGNSNSQINQSSILLAPG